MIILLTGGSACGKSSFAESLCMKLPGERYYIAAMKPLGKEGEARVARHRQMRFGKGFTTIERYTDIKNLKLPAQSLDSGSQPHTAAESGNKNSPAGPTALLECICNLTANEMFDEAGHIRDPYEAVISGVKTLSEQCSFLIIITNDTGSEDLSLLSKETGAYVRCLGNINSALAAMADTVCELVCGIPVVLKGVLPI